MHISTTSAASARASSGISTICRSATTPRRSSCRTRSSRRYLHINANGDVDPCVFIHYSNANIRSCTLLEALQSPIFMAYHDGQPFNDNHLRPCPMLENPQILREIVEKTGAHSTDPQSPETADHLCAKCDEYAKNWQPTAERLWACSHDCSTCGAGCGKKD